MSEEGTTVISTSLMKKLLLGNQPDQKVSNEALEAASFLLRQFIVEARNRASVEAEFDTTDNDDLSISSRKKRIAIPSLSDSQSDKEQEENVKRIKSRHILNISPELLMDFA